MAGSGEQTSYIRLFISGNVLLSFKATVRGKMNAGVYSCAAVLGDFLLCFLPNHRMYLVKWRYKLPLKHGKQMF